ncbi:ribosome biogenesis protein [Candidatus Woesearchaeota archaeon]|nr:ribosome biogenesis protein [Candidatus Woesearchaeota archaeon]
MKRIMKCLLCGSYTLKMSCSCGGKAVGVGPAKYSPHDPYGSYRRAAKADSLRKADLI